MTKEAVGRLFAKFTRLDTNRTRRAEGAGLGLYVARQIVREHRGEIEVDSPGVGKGTTFTVRLPRGGLPAP